MIYQVRQSGDKGWLRGQGASSLQQLPGGIAEKARQSLGLFSEMLRGGETGKRKSP